MEKNKILYVEDKLSLFGLMRNILRNYELTNANNLEDALSIIKQSDFDIYISDGRYPPRKGEKESSEAWKKFYESLKEMKGTVPFILFSGDFAAIEEAKSLGIKAFVKGEVTELENYLKKILKRGKWKMEKEK